MPTAPRRPCAEPLCRELQPCPTHKPHLRPGARYVDRKASEPWRVLYDTQRWRKARKRFLAANPLCVACDAENVLKLAAIVDHVVPHRGDVVLFWDEGNWQPLCASHHSAKTIGEVVNR